MYTLVGRLREFPSGVLTWDDRNLLLVKLNGPSGKINHNFARYEDFPSCRLMSPWMGVLPKTRDIVELPPWTKEVVTRQVAPKAHKANNKLI